MIDRKWVFKESGDNDVVKNLSDQLKIHPVLSRLLIQRDIDSTAEAKKYFNPDLDNLHDPFLMRDMDRAVDRILLAKKNDEKIMVYGDYDVDGTTAVSLMYLFLKSLGLKVEFYIPDRYKEGYGISKTGIEYAVETGHTLMVALDCGIKAVALIDYANELKLDVIICDHHEPGDKIPNAVAVLDPKRLDCPYPFKELSGCGVGFKIAHAICIRENLNLKENLNRYLDLVAISIASDIVPIVGENRILAHFGLMKIAKKPLQGVKQIKDIAGITDSNITISDLVFKVGPRINAAGRMESGKKAVDLLISEDEDLAREICNEIDTCNNERKDVDHSITIEALEMIDSSEEQKKKKTTVLYKKDWHKGVIGIVASRLTDYYYRPTVILTESNGNITGSARSVEGFDLYHAVESCSDLLLNFGGHRFAAGLTLEHKNLQNFIDRFEEYVSKNITEEQLTPKVQIDSLLKIEDVTPEFLEGLNMFQPFGPGNMNPVFASEEVEDIGWGKVVGKNDSHIKLFIKDQTKQGGYIDGIGFGLGHKADSVIQSKKFDICFSIASNTYNGVTKLQLELKDIKG